MPRKAAPLDGAGRPVPAVFTLGEILTWVLSRRGMLEPPKACMAEPAHEEVGRAAAQAWLEIVHHIQSGDLPIRGKAVSYRPVRSYLSPPIKVVAPAYETIPPEALVGRQLDLVASSVRTGHASGVTELWAEVVVAREDVLRLWRAPPRSARVQAKSRTIERCRQWLVGEMRASPGIRPQPKEWFKKEAERRFPGITDNAFVQVWRQARQETKAEWGKGGRPRKTP